MSTQQTKREISRQDLEMADLFWDEEKYDLMGPIEDAVNESMLNALRKMAADIRPRLSAEMSMMDNQIDIYASLDGNFIEGGKTKTFSEAIDEMIELAVGNGEGEDRDIRREVAEFLKSEANRITSQPD